MPRRPGEERAVPKASAGILLHRKREGRVQVLLVHPGGPLWARRDLGAWSIPKGEVGPGEEPLEVARREFAEETGQSAPGSLAPLATVRQPGGKTVAAWTGEGDLDPARLRSNTFAMEWPPRSGRRREFPEVDRAEWFPLAEARRRILKGQLGLLAALESRLSGGEGEA